MAPGIIGYGVYLPRYRIKAEEYTKAWSTFAAPGVKEKTVPGYDEDVATMAIEASRNAILNSGIKPDEIHAVYLGTTYGPYVEKPSSVTIAAALGVLSDVRTADFTATTKAGTAALLAGFDKVRAGDEGYTLVVASDAAMAAPDSNLEHSLGAGAAAFLLGNNSPIAILEDSYSVTKETYGERFKKPGDVFTRDLELRVQYFQESVTAAVTALLKKIGKEPTEINHVIVQEPDGRAGARAIGKFKFAKEQLGTGSTAASIGNIGACSTLLGLTKVLDSAKAGERILMVSYGAGSDALSLVVQQEAKDSPAPKLKDYLENKVYIDYVTYLQERRILSSFKS